MIKYINIQRIKPLLLALIACLIMNLLPGQDTLSHRSTFVSASFLQIKENQNYGLVFRGPAIDFGMNWTYPHKQNAWYYEYKIGLGAPFAKGIAGINLNIKPLEMAYLWKIPLDQLLLKAGPALKMEYNIEMYPDLQSGYYFWLTNYSAGIALLGEYRYNDAIFNLSFFNNLFGFVSRGEIYEDPYFFDRKFSDLVSDIHSDFEFMTPVTFNNTCFELTYRKNETARLAFSYVFDYFVYSDDPNIKFLNQSIRLTFIPHMKNEK